ncbi:hypothetical protein GOP47_0027637 [Adiantum capillus-veneris]|nr:hypothetical protein GOP47_0027637 [Adiantum capillus-veneris]
MLLIVSTTRLHLATGATGEIGVDYGLNGDNLPSPEQTVALLKSKGIARVRMYEARQEVTKAFANSGIELLLGIPNELLPKIAANLVEAINWVTQNVISFPNSGISAIIVGNEWLLDPAHDPSLLLPAMLNVYTVLTTTQLLSLDLSSIKVSTSHALNVLGVSFPPSAAQFNSGLLSVLSPILNFLDQTGSFFMVNVFPYFAYVEDSNVSLEFALFEAKEAVRDPKTGFNYTNLFDLQLDAVYTALSGRALAMARKSSSLGEVSTWRLNDYDVVKDQQQEEVNGRGSIGIPHASTGLQKRADRKDRHQDAERRSSRASRLRPRVLVGESGWPSGSGGSGSVPHSQLDSYYTGQYPFHAAHVMPPEGDVDKPRADVIPEYDVAQSPQCALQQCPAAAGGTAQQQSGDDVIPVAAELAAGVRRASAGSAVRVEKASCGFSARVCGAATVENARRYNQNLIRHVLQARGTPANPTTPIHAFIFALFDEDLKQPPGPEQHYGLFFPNSQPVYPITFH